MQIGSLPAGTNANATFTFTLPTLAPGTPLAITQTLIDSSGTLSATNPLLTETIGYISPSQVLTLQAAGMEIGNHTMDHCMLETLLADPNSATIPRSQSGAACPANGPLPAPVTASEEIDGARTALLGIGAAPVDTFAYPYGSGAGNPAIEQLIADAGMISARSVTAGYNTPATDPFSLNSYLVDATITDSTTVKQWIDYASLNHVWLILTFHQIETDAATIASKGEIDGTTTAILQEIVNYLHDQQAAGNIIVDTVHDVMTHYINH